MTPPSFQVPLTNSSISSHDNQDRAIDTIRDPIVLEYSLADVDSRLHCDVFLYQLGMVRNVIDGVLNGSDLLCVLV